MLDDREKLTREEKIDVEDVARELKKLPETEKRKIYYMIKGAQIVADDTTLKSKAVV